MTESHLQRAILLACNRDGTRLFRQNTGLGWTGTIIRQTQEIVVIADPRPLHAGLVEGSSDLIGWTGDGRFAAVEVKSHRGRVSEAQRAFIDAVRRAGGVAGVARTLNEAFAILGQRR